MRTGADGAGPALAPGGEPAPPGRRGVLVLFALATAIWGSTWLVITYQLGQVAPELSVAYRFALASVLLFLWCLGRGHATRLSAGEHGFVVLQGALMFGFNYVAVYQAERYVASGLVAVVFSTIVFMMPVAMRIAFGTPLARRSLAAAALGVAGIAMLFLPELGRVGDGGSVTLGVGFALLATTMAAAGNVVVVRNNRAGIPTLAGTAWGMLYGAAWAALTATALGREWTFDAGPAYVASLAYLALLGSVVAFLAYFALLKRAGPGPSSFTGVSTPVVAMLLSTAFEGYVWTGWAIAGVVLAVAGNVLALAARKPSP